MIVRGHTLNPIQSLKSKLDLFLRKHVLPRFSPERIFWCLSVSGGKDSYCLAHSLMAWYEERNLNFHGIGLHIDQWGGAVREIQELIPWLEIHIVNARSMTASHTGYTPGMQAPCRKCSDVRRLCTDTYLRTIPQNFEAVFVARALHLSDTAVSLLWRHTFGIDAAGDMVKANKAAPIAKLSYANYLVKPFSFVREFEAQAYAYSNGYTKLCCGCPACNMPGRRDIVEESILNILHSPFWEFQIPGLADLLDYYSGYQTWNEIMQASTPGIEKKVPHLSNSFFDFAVDYYLSKLKTSLKQPNHLQLDYDKDLDVIGIQKIFSSLHPLKINRLPAPALLIRPDSLTLLERKLISCLGPFWGALSLNRSTRDTALEYQQQLFGLAFDKDLSFVTDLIRKQKEEKNEAGPGSAVDAFFGNNSLSHHDTCTAGIHHRRYGKDFKC